MGRRTGKLHQGTLSCYLYHGQNEIGCLDSKGTIQELRLLGCGLSAEIGAAIAIEIQGQAFAPIHSESGHVMALIDSQTGKTKETYRYTAFGEE